MRNFIELHGMRARAHLLERSWARVTETRALALAVLSALALAACGRSRDTAPAASASASAAAASTPSTAASGFKPDAAEWCKWVFEVNHRHGLLVGNHYINPTPEQRKGSMKEALARRDEYIARS